MNAALVVMAAGLGSRYGGVKQIERVGPGGEILMEYAIYDALRAGFDKIIVIIKPEMRSDVKEMFGDRVERGAGVKLCYALQHMEGEWNGVPLPPARTKPLGTLHALLSAREFIDRPFAVINADDYYGGEAFAAVAAALPRLRGAGEAAMVAYRLRNTVSPFGTVTRGVCAVEDGYLKTITETYNIKLFPDGTIRDTSAGEDGPLLSPEAPVSMNLWGFHPDILPRMDESLTRFLRALDPADNKRECLLPVTVDTYLAAGALRCRVLHTDGRWFGLTYPEDKPGVVAALRELREDGVYPPVLWK